MDRPWEASYNVYFSNVMLENGLYRGWYVCRPPDHRQVTRARGAAADPEALAAVHQSGWSVCYAESSDGFHWHKPDLGILEYGGEPTNMVYGRGLSPHAWQSGSVYKDPHGPPAERYKLFYMGLIDTDDIDGLERSYRERFGDAGVSESAFLREGGGRGRARAMCAAVSQDGIRWTPIREPIMVTHSDTLNNIYWDERLQVYVAYMRSFIDDRRVVSRAQSPDFRTWRELPVPVLEPLIEWPPSDDIYTNSHAVYPGTENTHLMFPGVFHRLTDRRDIYLATSQNGRDWRWVPGSAVVKCGPSGSWNGGDLNPGVGLVPLSGDRIGLPIMGYARPHKFPRGGREILGAPGWATWPKGRIAALVADDRGSFSTLPLVFYGDQLSLNLKTLQSGEVLIELRDANGRPIAGRSFADASPITGDHFDRRATWHGKADIGDLSGTAIVASFRLRSASLYSFEVV